MEAFSHNMISNSSNCSSCSNSSCSKVIFNNINNLTAAVAVVAFVANQGVLAPRVGIDPPNTMQIPRGVGVPTARVNPASKLKFGMIQ